MTGRVAMFAYGSLVSPESAARTLSRPVPEPTPARLAGWRRRWSQFRDNRAVEKTFARRADGSIPPHVLGLTIEPADDEAEAPNGGLVEVNEAELRRLDTREIRYDRIEVPAMAGFERVFAYRAKPADRRRSRSWTRCSFAIESLLATPASGDPRADYPCRHADDVRDLDRRHPRRPHLLHDRRPHPSLTSLRRAACGASCATTRYRSSFWSSSWP